MRLATPVLFCVFNRPEVTRRVFAAIRAVQPEQLLIVQDGARPEHPDDQRAIAQVREIVQAVDWPCAVQTNFAESNLGCRQRMASGIRWAFAQCERLIILEDDCLPAPSFFAFCEAMLQRYADDPRVLMVSGNNFQPIGASPQPYYGSKYAHIWGWASWARAWQLYDLELQAWPSFRTSPAFDEICPDVEERQYWQHLLDLQYAGRIDSWDFPWMFAGWLNRAWTILPAANLVSNLGFGPGATHTTAADSPWANLPWGELELAAVAAAPQRPIEPDVAADQRTWERVFRPSPSPPRPRLPGWRKWWQAWSVRAGRIANRSPNPGLPTCR